MVFDLEKLYSPSQWSKRFAKAEDVERDHVAFAENESLRMREKWPFETIEFDSRQSHENFDVYGTHLASGAPLFVFIHGGYWQMLSKESSAYCVDPLVANGIKVAIMNYQLCPSVSLVEQMAQAYRSAVAILNYAVQNGASRVNFAGHSSGGHLLMTAMQRLNEERHPHLPLVHTIYAICGVYDLTELHTTRVANSHNVLQLNESLAREVSPMFYDYTGWRWPTRITLAIADNDAPRLSDQAVELRQRLAIGQYGDGGCVFILVSDHDHFDIVTDLSDRDFALTQSIIADFEEQRQP